MLDTIAYYESATGAPAITINGVADTVHTVNGDNITVPVMTPQVYCVNAGITNAADVIANCQLSSPSLRARTLLDVPNFNDMAASATYTQSAAHNISIFRASPINLTPGENLNCIIGSSATTAANLITAGVILGDGNYSSAYAGIPIETVRATSATTLTAHAWTNAALTMTQTLRAGTYAIVGLKAQGATMQMARLVLQTTANRPGVSGVTSLGHAGSPWFRQGNSGDFGTFSHVSTPTIDCLANAADTAQNFWLDLVKIA
jgi:hypothetical protein